MPRSSGHGAVQPRAGRCRHAGEARRCQVPGSPRPDKNCTRHSSARRARKPSSTRSRTASRGCWPAMWSRTAKSSTSTATTQQLCDDWGIDVPALWQSRVTPEKPCSTVSSTETLHSRSVSRSRPSRARAFAFNRARPQPPFLPLRRLRRTSVAWSATAPSLPPSLEPGLAEDPISASILLHRGREPRNPAGRARSGRSAARADALATAARHHRDRQLGCLLVDEPVAGRRGAEAAVPAAPSRCPS